METVKYVAHRGLSMQAPENTLPAFALACQSGFWGIECDIYCTREGKWFVFHDAEVNRMTDGTGKTMDYSSEEIDKLTIVSGHSIGDYTDLKIPTLEEVLAVCKEYGKYALVEIKGYHRDADLLSLIGLLERSGMAELCRLICFNAGTLRKVRTINKKIPLGYLSAKRPTLADLTIVHSLAPAFLDYYYIKTTSNDIRKCHDAGIEVAVWTIDTDEEAVPFVRAGVDYITTNTVLF